MHAPDPTSRAAIAEKYEAVSYAALPHPLTHPAHLAAIAAMFGAPAAPVPTATVLEVGCSDGANLLPLAAAWPQARFVGCDLAPSAIRRARETSAALGLRNVDWFEGDLATLPHQGPFDYVIAHGVYSWVPPDVRDALMALAAARLSAKGLLFVNYNLLPGAHTRRAVALMLRHRTAAVASMPDKVATARAYAALLADAGALHDAAEAGIRTELARVAQTSDSELAHDLLAEPNDAFLFEDVVAHARRHGLAFVAEAAPAMMGGAGLSDAMRRHVATLEPLSREQTLDFARVRRFRQSLFRRGDGPAHALRADAMDALHAGATTALLRAAAEDRLPAGGAAPAAIAARALLARLAERSPATTPVIRLLDELRQDRALAASRVAPSALLADLWLSGFLALSSVPSQAATRAGARPEAFALARWQAARDAQVTNLRHETVRLPEPVDRALLARLDGTLDRDALAMRVVGADGTPLAPGEVAGRLDALARHALLVR